MFAMSSSVISSAVIFDKPERFPYGHGCSSSNRSIVPALSAFASLLR